MYTLETAPADKTPIQFFLNAAGHQRARRYNRNLSIWQSERVDFARYLLNANKAVLVVS